KLHEWYRAPAPEQQRGGRGLTADEKSIAAGVLWILRGDAGLRALVACSMGWAPARTASLGAEHAALPGDWFAPYLAQLLQDPYRAVRWIAARSLRRSAGFENLDYVFLAEAPQLAAAADHARTHWQLAARAVAGGTGDGKRVPRPELLIDDQGNLDAETFA